MARQVTSEEIVDYNMFRIAQCNILNRGDFAHRYTLLAEACQAAGVDYLLSQEVVEAELFATTLEKAGYPHLRFSPAFEHHERAFYLAMASKTPLSEISLPPNPSASYLMGSKTTLEGRELNLFTLHLAHGFEKELERVEAVELLDQVAASEEAQNPSSISIAGGDFNALPESRSMRYLRGLDLNLAQTASTHWVDAWEACGRPDNWSTNVHGINPLGMLTAKGVGVTFPQFLPARRIDYLLTRGWAFGKAGCPLTFEYLRHPSGEIFTDHEPFYVDFLLPSTLGKMMS